jgi:preprotein translocase subunit SecD
MNRRYYINLAVILVLLAAVIWIDLPSNPGIKIGTFERSLETQLGLDLRGGLRTLLEVDLPETQDVDPNALADARLILENRANGLGVSEVQFQIAGTRRIVAEFPGLTNTDEVLAVLKQVGQLAFVPLGTEFMPEGTSILVDYTDVGGKAPELPATPTPAPTATPDAEGTTPVVTPVPATEQPTVYKAIMTGADIKTVVVGRDEYNKPAVDFTLSDEGAKIFGDFTSAHVGEILAIVMDDVIVSAPSIGSAITDGQGQISGSFTIDSANSLAVQLRYGSLPVPFKVVQSQVIGPTLGQDSLNKSLVAGLVGLIIVILFMAIFYRLPGGVADIAIIFFALLTLALYKFIPVTLTLPGIAGFLLSTGSALDANILIFERLKEELRSGRNLRAAIELGWKRAWPSIRDSNIATLITSAILFWFGSAYGASIVKGFAVTLSLGVVISLFCAIFVTRTLLNLVIEYFKPTNLSRWFGI